MEEYDLSMSAVPRTVISQTGVAYLVEVIISGNSDSKVNELSKTSTGSIFW